VGGGTSPAAAAFRPLVTWINDLAPEANLCLSITHVIELARVGRHADRRCNGCLADGIPIRWTKTLTTLQEEEDEHWLQVAVGLTSPTVEPLAPSMWSMFTNWQASDLPIALSPLACQGFSGSSAKCFDSEGRMPVTNSR